MVRNFILREPNVVLKIYKMLIRPHIEYCTHVWAPVSRHGNWTLILKFIGTGRSMTKIIRIKDLVIGRDKRN